jgi:ribose/xylose/arabinose/galactoside ABC-type transport system permease subunit
MGSASVRRLRYFVQKAGNIVPFVQGALPSLFLLILLAIGFSLVAPEFLARGNLTNVLRQAAPLFIAAAGQMIVVLVGGIDISVGAVVAVSSVCGALVAISTGTELGVLTAVATGMAAGLISGIAVAAFRVQPVIATIGMLSAARGLAFLISDGLPISPLPLSFLFLGNGYLLGVPVPIILAALLLIVITVWLRLTPTGRYLFAIGGSDDAARAAGIAVVRYRALAYAIGGGLAGLAAVIYSARSASGQPTFGYGLELETIGAVVLGGTALGGGRANVVGTAIGAVVITVLGNGMDLAGVSPYVQRIVVGVAIVVIVLVDIVRRRWSLSLVERRVLN